MSPCLVNAWVVLVLGCTHGADVALAVERSCPDEKFPVERSGGQVEAAGIDEEVGSSLPHKHGQLGESEVIANANTHLAVLGVKDTNVLSSVEGLGFVVGDFSGDVDVKEMHFIVGGLQFSLGVDDEGSVEEFLVGGFAGDGSNGVHAILGGLLLDGVQGGRI